MQERPTLFEPVQMRKARPSATQNKGGDYVLPYTIEQEMEKNRDHRKYDEQFVEKQLELELDRQANLYNMILDQQDQNDEQTKLDEIICPGSKRILANLQGRGGKIHDRLHEMSKMIKQKKANQVLSNEKFPQDEDLTYNPAITEYSK